MRCTYCIHVETFHLHQVGFNLSFGECTATIFTETVAVHTMEDDAVTIDKQRTILTYADGAETNLQCADVRGLSLFLEG